MIELTKRTRQDFLDREWVQKLLNAGVDMSDAKYCIERVNGIDYVEYIGYYKDIKPVGSLSMVPTYSTAELMYKLHEWVYPVIDGHNHSGGIEFMKDAPFYSFYYNLRNIDTDESNQAYLYAEDEYPICALAELLLQCMTKGVGCVADISKKGR